MCKIKVSFPKLNKFMFFYSLRAGCTVIFMWHLLRTLASLTLALTAIPELFLGGNKAFDNFYLTVDEFSPPLVSETRNFLVYGIMVVFLMTETTNLVHVAYLGSGLFCVKSAPVKNFLISRAFTWLLEVFIVAMLCFVHTILLGWYLIMLIIFMIEVYGYSVIYSYYCELRDIEKAASKPPPDWV